MRKVLASVHNFGNISLMVFTAAKGVNGVASYINDFMVICTKEFTKVNWAHIRRDEDSKYRYEY